MLRPILSHGMWWTHKTHPQRPHYDLRKRNVAHRVHSNLCRVACFSTRESSDGFSHAGARRKLFAEFEAELKAVAGTSAAGSEPNKELKSLLNQLQKALENDVLVAKLSSSPLLKKEFFLQLLGRVVQLPSIKESKLMGNTYSPEMVRAMDPVAASQTHDDSHSSEAPSPSRKDIATAATSEYGELGIFDVSSEENTRLSMDLAKVTHDMISEDPTGATSCCQNLRSMIQKRHLSCVRHYLSHAESMMPHGLTPHHIAAFVGDLELFQMAHKETPKDAVSVSKLGWTPMHFCAFQGNSSIARQLLKLGAKMNPDSDGNSPIHLAALEGHADLITLFSDNLGITSMKNDDGATPAHLAADNGHLAALRSLVNRNYVLLTEKTLRLETPLFLAASSGHRDVVSYLIQFAKSTLNTPDIDGNTPLQGAAHASHDRVVEDLVAAGADLHIRDNIGNTALHYACWVGCARAAQVLLSGGADPRVKNEDDSFPIHYAAQEGYLECVKTLHKGGASMDVANASGATPLLLAIRKKCVDVAEYLIDSGCDVNKHDSHGTGPLLAALEAEMTTTCALLIAKGADVSAKRFDFVTPMHMAIQTAQLDLAHELLNRGADALTKTVEGLSCLHLAVEIGSEQLITALVKRGCDVNEASDEGVTPLSIAKRNNDASVESLLRSLGAKEMDVFKILEAN